MAITIDQVAVGTNSSGAMGSILVVEGFGVIWLNIDPVVNLSSRSMRDRDRVISSSVFDMAHCGACSPLHDIAGRFVGITAY